ncbi:hypothetical protein [Streptomyces sp. NPDC008001]|uniref:hypothetical protein n=1 Tax=Streptomyces sp. NPDC008001 TaxID=3364804 RepID=UPI0036E0B370
MAVEKQAHGSREGDSAEADRRRAEGAAEGSREAERRLAGQEPDHEFGGSPTSRASLSLTVEESGTATITARGGNGIPKAIRVVDESGTLIAAYMGFALDDLSVAKSARSSVAGAIALSLDSTDEEDEAKAESPSGVIAGRTGEDVPVQVTPEEFRDRAVALFAGELIDLSRELRGTALRQAGQPAGGAPQT